MTPSRRRVLLAVARHWQRRGCAPSLEQLRAACRFRSRSAAEKHVKRLCADGYLRHEARTARSVRLTEAGEREARMARRAA